MSKEQILSICFSITPDIRIRVINDNDPGEIKAAKKRYPFELHNCTEVCVVTTYREFKFLLPAGYTWNGADIPRFLWRIAGSRTDNDFLIASMLHDYMLEFKSYMIRKVLKNQISIKEYRRLTSLVFREKVISQGTSKLKSSIMSWCVDVFQHYFNRKEWNCLISNDEQDAENAKTLFLRECKP